METVAVARWLVDLLMSIAGVLIIILGYRVSLKMSKENWYWWGALVGGMLGIVLVLVTQWIE